jgi:hypothetical protein
VIAPFTKKKISFLLPLGLETAKHYDIETSKHLGLNFFLPKFDMEKFYVVFGTFSF